ncbi:uncharacterized protein LOC116769414 isoform X3 [Danaus plexippus]|uniref:uncharacterized protein LOC116769414 isoform X3 n=1 Tax=Danaus plexippus TaxID=13037 RepID=UPI002AAFC6D0|nr:uncharacterized protein LOC116769414 isoform X3 [Danaus plexippus]
MIKQKGTRVRISSHKNLINDLEEYFHNESKCSCPVCDSISCFQIRRFNSGLSCTCVDCNRDRCLTWDNSDDSTHDKPPDTDAASKGGKAPEIGIKPKKKCSAPMNDKDQESSCCTKDCNTPGGKRIVSNDYAVQIEIKMSDDSNVDSLNDRTSKNYDDFVPEFYKKDDIENVKSDFIKIKPDTKKCCSSNTCFESKNTSPERTAVNLDNNTFEYSDLLNIEDKKVIASEEKREHTDAFSSNTVQNADSTSHFINFNNMNENRDDRNSRKSKVMPEFKKCASSKNFGSKSYKIHSNKSCVPGIEAQPKEKDTHFHNTGYIKTSKTIRNEMYTKRYDDAKKVFNGEDFDNPKDRDIFTKENKNLEKCYNVSKYLKIEEDKLYRPKNKIEKDSNVENGLASEDSLDNEEIVRLQKIINLLTHIDDKQENDGSNLKQCVYTDVSHSQKKTIRRKNEKSSEKSSSHLKTIALSYSKPDYSNSRAELSAQVMNVPYEELKETLSRRHSSVHSDLSNSPKESPKLDIFSKLKELYKACSCKVCECLPSNSFSKNSDICNCKPCDCDDCKKYMEKLRKRLLNRPTSGCPCVACDRKDCRGVVKDDKSSVCDCEPCNCVKYTESCSKPCNCVPCQCELCKPSIPMPQALMVSNMTQIYHQSNCDCDPCECQNCTSSYSAMTSNLMREASTGIITYGNCNCRACANDSCQLNASSCRCDVQNDVMRKPLAKNSPDYGIHRVYVREKPYGKTDAIKKHRNTIAMFALSDTYSNRLFSYSNQNDTCKCEVCECLVCKDKGKLINYDDKPKYGININKKSIPSGYCVPCQCETCKKYNNSNAQNFDENFSFKYKYNTENNKKVDGNNISREDKLIKRSKLTFASPEVNSLNKLLKGDDVSVNEVFSKKSEDLVDDDHCYLLKKGKLLTSSILKNIVSKRGSSHVLVKSDDNESCFKENDNNSKHFPRLNSSLCQQLKFADTCKQDESFHTYSSPKSSKNNTTSKEKETTEIFKHNSLDLMNSNVSNTFRDDSNDNIKKDVCDDLLHENLEKSKMEVNDADAIVSSQKHLVRSYKKTKESLNITNVLNNKIHLSSAKSMSLVQSLCKERNINIDDQYTSKYLQSIEKLPLKTIKMEFNSINASDENQKDISKNDSDVNFCKVTSKMRIPQINDKNDSETFVYGNIDIVKHETEHTVPPINDTDSNLKETDIEDDILKDNYPKIESDVNDMNKQIRAQRMVPLVKINKARKANKPSKPDPELMLYNKQIKNKRYLELPDRTDTASSVINFNSFDKFMKFYESVPLENDDSEQKNQEDILGRKIVYVSADAICTNPLEPNRKNSLKSISQQTSAVPLYFLGSGQGNRALNKLQIEVNDLLNSPILQSKHTIGQIKRSWNESKMTLKTISRMNDATSQTQRVKIAVDKEIDCNLILSADSKSVKQQFDFFAVNRNNKKGVKTKLCSESNKVDVSSQYARRPKSPSYIKTFDGSKWQNIDNTFELEQYLEAEKEDAFTSNKNSSKKIRISEMPRVKIIAEKLPKKNNVKSKKLEEQIVCLEYDVFTSDHHYAKPSQTMKAYFSVKPIGRDEENIPMLPTSRKRYFNVANEDFDTLNETDVDIIDAKVAKNKSYLDILENILIRKQKIYTNEKKSTLDLMSLYQMAKSDIPLFDKNFSNRY